MSEKKHFSGRGLGVRSILEKWNLLPPDSKREDVGKLGLKVKKVIKSGCGYSEIIHRISKKTPDLLILGTSKRNGAKNFFGRDMAASIGCTVRQTTLYIPERVKPLIDFNSGEINVGKILVPVAADPSPEIPFEMLQRLMPLKGWENASVVLLHYGDVFPSITMESLHGLSFRKSLLPRNKASIPDVIVREARHEKADLVIMATNGRNTISQRIIGSITEQVIRKVPCPVLAAVK
jgi:nucleotide-binding universal stress UspA family protein